MSKVDEKKKKESGAASLHAWLAYLLKVWNFLSVAVTSTARGRMLSELFCRWYVVHSLFYRVLAITLTPLSISSQNRHFFFVKVPTYIMDLFPNIFITKYAYSWTMWRFVIIIIFFGWKYLIKNVYQNNI